MQIFLPDVRLQHRLLSGRCRMRWHRLLLVTSVLLVVHRLAVAESAPNVAADSSDPPAGGSSLGSPAWRLERELLEYLQVAPLKAADDLPLMRLCVERSWWAAARKLVERAHASAGIVAMKDQVSVLLKDVKSQADGFAALAEETYRGQTAGLNEVRCAVQWAQNSTTVFLGVKYAARWSAPGAIEVTDVTANISSSGFALSGYGHHSSIRKHYIVDLPMYGSLLPDISSWSAASVGRMTATLHKEKPGKWPRLTLTKDKVRHPITKWMDMEERWAAELEKTAPAKEKKPEAKHEKKPEKKKKSKEKTWRKAFDKLWKRIPSQTRRNLGSCMSVLGLVVVVASLGLLVKIRRKQKRLDAQAVAVAASSAAECRAKLAAELQTRQSDIQGPASPVADSARVAPGETAE